MGPLVLLGVEVPLEPEGVDAAEDDEAGEADAEADSEEAGPGLEEGNRARHPDEHLCMVPRKLHADTGEAATSGPRYRILAAVVLVAGYRVTLTYIGIGFIFSESKGFFHAVFFYK